MLSNHLNKSLQFTEEYNIHEQNFAASSFYLIPNTYNCSKHWRKYCHFWANSQDCKIMCVHKTHTLDKSGQVFLLNTEKNKPKMLKQSLGMGFCVCDDPRGVGPK